MIISPDHYLYDENGVYVWTPERASNGWESSRAALALALQDASIQKVVLMVGLPGAGKSTWLAANATDQAVYFDATSCRRRDRVQFLQFITERSTKPVEAVVFTTPADVANQRNARRSDDRRVPDVVVAAMAQALAANPVSVGEGFAAVSYV